MKRHFVEIDAISNWHNIAAAAHQAARGKRKHQNVATFFNKYEESIEMVQQALQSARLPYGNYRSFKIYDPKPRIIHAAPFADRVAHHAMMNPLNKILDDWQVPSSFACRVGKGAHPSVKSHCRYMDDTVVWCENKNAAKNLYVEYADWLKQSWLLNLKPAIIQQTRMGLSFCGYRIHPQVLKPGRRRLRQFAKRYQFWQTAFEQDEININTLQQNCDSLLAMLEPGRSWHWRKNYFQQATALEL